MSTTGMIRFRDGDQEVWIRRGHDGHPEMVLPDLEALLQALKEWPWGRWSGAEMGQLVALFFVMTGGKGKRLQPYEWAPGLPGDESYIYVVECVDGWRIRTPSTENMDRSIREIHGEEFCEKRFEGAE